MITAPILVGLCALSRPTLGDESEHFGPSKDFARRRAPEIFNAVHNAMRQWGSSVHHNGMSLFLATVPEGVLFHHGNGRPESPSEPDWLAYEMEHAEQFTRSFGPPPKQKNPNTESKPDTPADQQKVMASKTPLSDAERGWLHVYRTTRPLQFLYIDGMSGAKTDMGTLDMQDYLLRSRRSHGEVGRDVRQTANTPIRERERAEFLCELCKEWHLQGVIRMEAGFEIIKCNFTDGLEQVQAFRRPRSRNSHGLRSETRQFEYLRGIAERYFDIGSSRTVIDYSSMVSAFFFPVNLTNPDTKRPDLPRLSQATDADLATINGYFNGIVSQRQNETRRQIDWQDVSDIIVSRYADRLEYMVKHVASMDVLALEINFLLDVYIDYPDEDEPSLPNAVNHCKEFYLKAVSPASESDDLIHAAFRQVMSEICTALFEVRESLSSKKLTKEQSLATSTKRLQSLMQYLDWARFKRCSGCGVDEVCVIPMWPFGDEEDYYHPRCRNSSDTRRGKSYWGRFTP
ncbi:hypothetical protein J3458_001559 [Metarhizium acridum]|uniref:uncharacterized protein n=1 Tax=Metarhizium acridum TaxID=92637 RepID=UPI001C6B80F9|nr:hypothetical protein J3458_001559 [Metarhizium acridum]